MGGGGGKLVGERCTAYVCCNAAGKNKTPKKSYHHFHDELI